MKKAIALTLDLGTCIGEFGPYSGVVFPNVIDALRHVTSIYKVKVFMITARRERIRKETERQLDNLGISPFLTQLYMWKEDDAQDVMYFKYNCREKIRQQG
jgi:hypothetical protein